MSLHVTFLFGAVYFLGWGVGLWCGWRLWGRERDPDEPVCNTPAYWRRRMEAP